MSRSFGRPHNGLSAKSDLFSLRHDDDVMDANAVYADAQAATAPQPPRTLRGLLKVWLPNFVP